jgi:2-haloacid dehalogenase
VSKTQPTTVVLDIGNVLIGWDPRNLYRKLLPGREDDMEWFLANVCTGAWNLEQDRGRSFAEGVALLLRAHEPRWHELIRAYDERWVEMLSGEIAGSVALLDALHERGVALYAITNWNQDTFERIRPGYPFLARFRGIVVSGRERIIKPEPAIYRLLFERYALDPADCVFVDDSGKNVRGAEAAGMHGVAYESPAQQRAALLDLGFGL